MIIADAHLDLAMNALNYNRDLDLPLPLLREAENGSQTATVTLPAMRGGGVALCSATLFARTARRNANPPSSGDASREISYAKAQGQLAYYRRLEEQRKIRILRRAADIKTHLDAWKSGADGGAEPPIGALIAMEGADPIAYPQQAEQWHRDGLRVLSLAHYGVSAYAGGTGAESGLQPDGAALLREMERLGIVLDATHLSDRSFWEALDAYGGPVHASHSNCRAIAPGARQMDDAQIRAVAERGGVIGTALDSEMLIPNWKPNQRASVARAADHIDHVCQIAGSAQNAGFGSDLDGGFGRERIPREIDSIADLRVILETLRQRGYSDRDIENIASGNWIRFFTDALPQRL